MLYKRKKHQKHTGLVYHPKGNKENYHKTEIGRKEGAAPPERLIPVDSALLNLDKLTIHSLLHCRSPPIVAVVSNLTTDEKGGYVMVKINLREFYPYTQKDTFIEVSTEVADMMKAFERAEASYERKVRRYKAYYSLNHKTGIERSILFTSHSPEELYERKLTKEELHTAIAQLPDKQAKRIYAHYLLGMSKEEIARAEGVSWHTVHQSIQQGLRRMENILKNS